MQIYAINGSPRKKWNTATILENVLAGAAEAEADVLSETINLYDYNYKGCASCFHCKRIGGHSYGKCVIKDGIHDLLQKILQADIIVFGSPIYFSDMTGMMRSFLERLLFPVFVYDKNYSSIAPKKIFTAFVYTMNVPHAMMEQLHYTARLAPMENFVGNAFGHKPRILHVNNTYQFPDYSKYKNELFSVEDKERQRKEQFPIDCKNAKELGAALVADFRASHCSDC